MSVYIPEKAKETYLIHILFLNTASSNLYSYTSNKEDIISFLDEYIKKLNNPYNNLKRYEDDEFVDETTPVENTKKFPIYYQKPNLKRE